MHSKYLNYQYFSSMRSMNFPSINSISTFSSCYFSSSYTCQVSMIFKHQYFQVSKYQYLSNIYCIKTFQVSKLSIFFKYLNYLYSWSIRSINTFSVSLLFKYPYFSSSNIRGVFQKLENSNKKILVVKKLSFFNVIAESI